MSAATAHPVTSSSSQLTSETQPVLGNAYDAVRLPPGNKPQEKTVVVYQGPSRGNRLGAYLVKWTDGKTYYAIRTSEETEKPEFQFFGDNLVS